jgi:hypothetical protein
MRRIAYSDLSGVILAVVTWIVVGLISIVAFRAVLAHH